MSTSGSITGLATVRDVIYRACELIGKAENGSIPAEEAQTCLQHLRWMLKSWQVDGCNLWRQDDETASFAANVATVTLSPRVLDVIEARVVISATYERALERWELGDYAPIPNKASAGTPTVYVLNKGRTAVTMTVWPVPTVATSVKYTGARVVDDVTNLNETLDLPQEWTETVIYNLAKRLIPIFGSVDPVTVKEVKDTAAELYAQLRDFDRPAYYSLTR